MATVTSENKESFDREFMEKKGILKKEINKRSSKKENFTDKPMAASGLKSYRYKGRYGHIMIGAKDHDDAVNEAKRSTRDNVSHENLEMWDEKANKYVPVKKQLNQ
jgi:uncharacterized short protein YbdD (DUF466 family)